LELGLLPVPGQQLIDSTGAIILQPAEHICEPGARIDVIELTGFDQRVDGSGALAAAV
jgi:hypothetical protein